MVISSMSRRLRGRLRWRAGGRVSLLALVLAACGNNGTAPPIVDGVVHAPSTPTVGTAASGGAPSPPTAITVEAPTSVPTCEPAVAAGSFADVGIADSPRVPSRVLYSWTSVEQAEELVAGGPLLSRTERPGQGPGHAIEYLRDQYSPVNDDDAALRDLLLSEPFSRARYAWPYAWATRMGWPATADAPAETYGNQLLRIVVKPDALWVVVEPQGLSIVDNDGDRVALAESDRIVGIYFVRGEAAGGANCGGSFGAQLFTSFREFILMNPNMVESWALGTEEVRAAVRSDIEQLQTFFEVIRSCPTVATVERWAADIVCSNWQVPYLTNADYLMHLALLNAHYLPRAAEVAAIVDALQSDVGGWELSASNRAPLPAADAGAPDDAGHSETVSSGSSGRGAQDARPMEAGSEASSHGSAATEELR